VHRTAKKPRAKRSLVVDAHGRIAVSTGGVKSPAPDEEPSTVTSEDPAVWTARLRQLRLNLRPGSLLDPSLKDPDLTSLAGVRARRRAAACALGEPERTVTSNGLGV